MDEKTLEEQLEIAKRLLRENGKSLRYAGWALVDYYKTVMTKALVENLDRDEKDVENMGIKNKFTHLKIQAPETKNWENRKEEIRKIREKIAHSDYSRVPEKEKLEKLLEEADDFRKDILEKTSNTYVSIDSFWDLYSKKLEELENWMGEVEEASESIGYSHKEISEYGDLIEKYELSLEEKNEDHSLEDIRELVRIEFMIKELENEYDKIQDAIEDMAIESQRPEMPITEAEPTSSFKETPYRE